MNGESKSKWRRIRTFLIILIFVIHSTLLAIWQFSLKSSRAGISRHPLESIDVMGAVQWLLLARLLFLIYVAIALTLIIVVTAYISSAYRKRKATEDDRFREFTG